METHFPKEGKFEIGVEKLGGSYIRSFTGTLTYLNIWSALIADPSIRPMAGGVMNVKGNLLAWQNVPEYIIGNLTMVPNTEMYNPGNNRFL